MQTPKSNIELKWKEHNVDLTAFDSWLRSIDSYYCGNSADSKLTLWFMEEVSQEIIDVIQAKWGELDDAEHEMAKSYKSREQIEQAKKSREDAIKSKKLSMVSKTWGNMSSMERKLVMGLDDEVTNEELGL